MSASKNKLFPHQIIDIKFQGGKAFVLKEMEITSRIIEKQLSKVKYSGQNRKLSSEVEKARLPPFALAFYKLVFEFGKIPTEKELTDYYQAKYFTPKDDKNLKCFYGGKSITIDKEGLEGRLMRTYPSLIRDFHFYLKCTECKLFDEVTYSLSSDYFEGIDLCIKYKEETFSVSMFIDSQRAKLYKEKKYKRHNYSDKNEIILVIDLKKSSNRVSNFSLYSDEILIELISKIKDANKK